MYLRLPFVIQAKAFDNSFKKVKCVSITINNGNINEIIRTILKNVYKKYLSSNIDEVIKTIVV